LAQRLEKKLGVRVSQGARSLSMRVALLPHLPTKEPVFSSANLEATRNARYDFMSLRSSHGKAISNQDNPVIAASKGYATCRERTVEA
jgi:hypothetical protein